MNCHSIRNVHSTMDSSNSSTKGQTIRKTKKASEGQRKKDPKAPKRFRSAYIFFAKRRFQERKKQFAQEGIQHKVWIWNVPIISLFCSIISSLFSARRSMFQRWLLRTGGTSTQLTDKSMKKWPEKTKHDTKLKRNCTKAHGQSPSIEKNQTMQQLPSVRHQLSSRSQTSEDQW